ncbi:MAG: 6-bladed beta-propeller [Phycisphaerales bacterium JB039]
MRRSRPSRARPLPPVARSAAAACLMALGGCASKPGVILEPGPDSPRWPPPPDEPRLVYLGELSSAADLKPGRSALSRLGRALFGAEPDPHILSPMGLCFDGAGRMFIADSDARVVHIFDLETRKYTQLAPPEDLDRFVHPVAVAWDPGAQRLLVSDPGAAAVFAFDDQGALLGTVGDDRLVRPVGVAVHPEDGRIYIADTGAHRVAVYSQADVLLQTIGQRGAGPGEFNFPTYIAVDGDGRLYVSDSLNFRVQVFDPDGQPLRQFGEQGDMPGYFSQPKGLAVGDDGHLYVVDANFEAVQVFDREGALLMTFGHEGVGPGEFWLPAGISIDEKGRIWVADSYNRRVQAFGPIAPEDGQ